MTTGAATPLDPRCPCGSARRLMQCCGAVPGGEFTDAEVEEAMAALVAYGNRDEFAAALRRNNRELVADLTPREAESLFAARELDVKAALVVLLHTEMPARRSDSVASLLLQRKDSTVAARPRALLAQWAAQPLSLYEVIEPFPGQGVELRDRLRGFTVRVHERTASSQLGPGWFIVTRVRLRPDGVPVLDMPILPFDSRAREEIIGWLEDLELEPGSTTDPRLVVSDLFVLWLEYMAGVLTAPSPKLQNSDGDEIVLCSATFEIPDHAALLAALAAHREWEAGEPDDDEDSDEWTWFEPAGGEACRALGHLRLDGERAVLEVNSRERLAKARAMLEGMGFRFVTVEQTTAAEMFARSRMRAVGDEPVAPAEADEAAEVDEDLTREALDRHYRKWVDESLPMFGGRTPREMAKHDPDALARAIWRLCQGHGAQRYDATWMYAELGVRPLGQGRFEPGVVGE